jgi:ABC-type antimicrobial peptide transport system permease subunit
VKKIGIIFSLFLIIASLMGSAHLTNLVKMGETIGPAISWGYIMGPFILGVIMFVVSVNENQQQINTLLPRRRV